MKKMILNILLLSTRSTEKTISKDFPQDKYLTNYSSLKSFHSTYFILILAFIASVLCSFINNELSSAISKMNFYDASTNEQKPICPDQKYILVLRNGFSCLECLSSVNAFMKANKTDNNILFEDISMCDSSTLDRKKAYASAKRIFPDSGIHLVQYDLNRLNIFSLFDTHFTPEIILVNGKSVLHLSYKELFENAGSSLSVNAQLKISNFFSIK